MEHEENGSGCVSAESFTAVAMGLSGAPAGSCDACPRWYMPSTPVKADNCFEGGRTALVQAFMVSWYLGLFCVGSALGQHTSTFHNSFGRMTAHQGHVVTALGGLSLVGARWHAAGSGLYEGTVRSISARLRTTLRAGTGGAPGSNADEWYDALRVVEDARLHLRQDHPLLFRVGLIENLRMGPGHIVNFFSSSTAWDDRTVGGMVAYSADAVRLEMFTENLLMDGVAGGRITIRPLANQAMLATRSASLGFSATADWQTDLRGYSTDLQFDLFESGSILFAPFASYAWYDNLGDGLAIGATVYSSGFLGLISFGLRVAAFYNRRGFLPGYVGSFYGVHNKEDRIVQADRPDQLAGVTLEQRVSGNDLLTEFRLAIGEDFEFWTSFRKHFGAHRLSEYHLRMELEASRVLRVSLGMDLGGLNSIFSVLNDFGDQTALVLVVDYRLAGPLYLNATTRYSFERIDDNRFLVQRRFEPLTGLRWKL